MNGRGKAHRRPGVLDRRGARHLLGLVRCKNTQRVGDTRGEGASDDGLEIDDEGLVGEMAMRIDHHYRTRLPGGGGSSKATSMGRPPSGLAASTMPFDSTPMSFAGFRLATTATSRPTSASAS